jgi:hypothetical protein
MHVPVLHPPQSASSTSVREDDEERCPTLAMSYDGMRRVDVVIESWSRGD